MATVVCELHQSIDYFDWTGFYRVVDSHLLKIGPYQGSHGCLQISFDRGVCGAAARTQQAQIVEDVNIYPDHIACSSSTRSEIVLPVFDKHRHLIAVLDVDSNREASFDTTDCHHLERILNATFTRD
ncbi:MAG: GAF domain-containing protein [Cellvibrionaceae bacterium]|nr:GAF domain-containing protein [Cellvibrionaceae bacterium]